MSIQDAAWAGADAPNLLMAAKPPTRNPIARRSSGFVRLVGKGVSVSKRCVMGGRHVQRVYGESGYDDTVVSCRRRMGGGFSG